MSTSDLAVVPQRLVAHAPGLVVREPPLSTAGFAKTAVWHERTHRLSGHRWARALMFGICGCDGADVA